VPRYLEHNKNYHFGAFWVNRQGLLAERLQHQLHRHQHRIVAAPQPASARVAGVVDKATSSSASKRTVRSGTITPETDSHFSRKGFDNAAIRKRAPMMLPTPPWIFAHARSVVHAERFQRARKILVRPQPQREGAAGCPGTTGADGTGRIA